MMLFFAHTRLRMKLSSKKELHVGPTGSQNSSGFQKPDGLTAVRPENVRDFLFPLPVSVIPYIGKSTEALKEDKQGRRTADFKVQVLSERFGKQGILMKQRANGIILKRLKREKV